MIAHPWPGHVLDVLDLVVAEHLMEQEDVGLDVHLLLLDRGQQQERVVLAEVAAAEPDKLN